MKNTVPYLVVALLTGTLVAAYQAFASTNTRTNLAPTGVTCQKKSDILACFPTDGTGYTVGLDRHGVVINTITNYKIGKIIFKRIQP